MAHEESAELTKPGVGAFDDPAAFVGPELSAIFMFSLFVVFEVWNNEVDASLLQALAQRVGVAGAVGDHAFRLLPRMAFGAMGL